MTWNCELKTVPKTITLNQCSHKALSLKPPSAQWSNVQISQQAEEKVKGKVREKGIAYEVLG